MSNEIQQTAVEWLIEQLQKTRHYQRVINEANESSSLVIDVIEQAKAMEKEKMIEFGELVWKNSLRSDKIMKSRDVYNETYGGNK